MTSQTLRLEENPVTLEKIFQLAFMWHNVPMAVAAFDSLINLVYATSLSGVAVGRAQHKS